MGLIESIKGRFKTPTQRAFEEMSRRRWQIYTEQRKALVEGDIEKARLLQSDLEEKTTKCVAAIKVYYLLSAD